MFNLKASIKSLAFTIVLYGWMIPTLGLGQMIKSWLPMEIQMTQQWQISKVNGNDNTATWDFSMEPSPSENPDEVTEDNTRKKEVREEVARTEDVVSEQIKDSALVQSEPVITAIGAKATQKISPKIIARHPSIKSIHTKKKRTTKKRGKKCSPKSLNITQVGKRSYNLPKKVIRHYSRNWKEAQQLAHLRWSTKDQKRQGIKIQHISCKSPLRLSGLEKGDVVVSINGHKIQKDADLLKVYGRLMVWKKMEIKVKRNQRFITVKYSIV
jgi:type II secretory pathway component PulC